MLHFTTLSKPVIFYGALLVYCEYVIYYVVLYQCSWPADSKMVETDQAAAKIMLLADIHLLGKRKGHWFDKLRREWQMYRSFQTAVSLHKPEIIFILGDIFDEGSFSPDELYNEYLIRFSELFLVPEGIQLYVVAGNHDIGFHYAMHPYLERRFRTTLNAPLVKILTVKNNHFILVNSMAMEGDDCTLCTTARKRILKISDDLKCANDSGPCYDAKIGKYSRPIILQVMFHRTDDIYIHFPLYRSSDSHCADVDSAPIREKGVKFKESWDCLSKESTRFLLKELKPRVVFSGHTHHACHTVHDGNTHEFTIPSFNWRNKQNPSFTLAIFKPESYAVAKCTMPSEYAVISIYAAGVSLSILYLVYTLKKASVGRKTHVS